MVTPASAGEDTAQWGNVSAERLRSLIERSERLEEERKALGGDIKDIKGSDELVPKMVALIDKLAERFADPATPYIALPWPEFIPHFNDYEHLERVAEWSSAGGLDE